MTFGPYAVVFAPLRNACTLINLMFFLKPAYIFKNIYLEKKLYSSTSNENPVLLAIYRNKRKNVMKFYLEPALLATPGSEPAVC